MHTISVANDKPTSRSFAIMTDSLRSPFFHPRGRTGKPEGLRLRTAHPGEAGSRSQQI